MQPNPNSFLCQYSHQVEHLVCKRQTLTPCPVDSLASNGRSEIGISAIFGMILALIKVFNIKSQTHRAVEKADAWTLLPSRAAISEAPRHQGPRHAPAPSGGACRGWAEARWRGPWVVAAPPGRGGRGPLHGQVLALILYGLFVFDVLPQVWTALPSRSTITETALHPERGHMPLSSPEAW